MPGKRVTVSIVAILVMVSVKGISQDTIHHLPAVEIGGTRFTSFSVTNHIQKFDSSNLQLNPVLSLTELLNRDGLLFIKSNGPGLLASSSIRGAGAEHTAILWNGFNIQSPMNGQFDLSLIPVFFMNDIQLQSGGGGALFGSGAMGGVIQLNSEQNRSEGISAMAGLNAGSFENYLQTAGISLRKKQWATTIKLLHQSTENNFHFYNRFIPGNPLQQQVNATNKQNGLLLESFFSINEHQKINVRYWYQSSNRNIPSTMLESSGNTSQQDENHRVSSEWKRTGKWTTWYVRSAFFNERIDYSDLLHQTFSNAVSQVIISEAENKIYIGHSHLLNTGINNTYTQAQSLSSSPFRKEGYTNDPRQNRTAFFVSYRFLSKKEHFQLSISGRQEVVTENFFSVPFTYSGGILWAPKKWLALKVNGAKIYRLPTFNERYWTPGGNPQLLPESGYSEDIGASISYRNTNQTIDFTFDPVLFNRTTENWIIWLPQLNYWSPRNLMQVWSRGMETRSVLTSRFSGVVLKTELFTNYVLSTSELSKTDNDASLGKQLIYVPLYSGHIKLLVYYKNFTLMYHHNYFGYRFTSTDNTEYLLPYTLGTVHLSKILKIKKYRLKAFLEVSNLFNEQYQTILTKAMPLRNYMTGISIQLN